MKIFKKLMVSLSIILIGSHSTFADKSNLKEQKDCSDKVYAEKNPEKCPCEGGCSSGDCGAGSGSGSGGSNPGYSNPGRRVPVYPGGGRRIIGPYPIRKILPILKRKSDYEEWLIAMKKAGRKYNPGFGSGRKRRILPIGAVIRRGGRIAHYLNSLKYQISCGKGGVANEPELSYGGLMIHEEKPSELLFSPQTLIYSQTLASKLIEKDSESLPEGTDRKLDFTLPSGRVLNFELKTGEAQSTLSGELQTEGMVLERLDSNWQPVTVNEVYYVRYYPGLATKVYYDATTLLPIKYVSSEGRTVMMDNFPIEVVYDDLDEDGIGETLRQVYTGNHLFDIVVPEDGITANGTSCKYEIRCYDLIAVGDKDEVGRYTIDQDGKPFITYIISNTSENKDTEFDKIQISQVNNLGTSFEVAKNSNYTYSLASNEWTVSVGDGAYNESLAKEENADQTINKEIRLVTDHNDIIVSKSVDVEYKINGEYSNVASINDPDGDAETSVSVYYTNSADASRFNTTENIINEIETCFETSNANLYGKSRGYVDADGSWSLTFYDSDGREVAEAMPYLNTTWNDVKSVTSVESLPAGCIVTKYDYTPLTGDSNKTDHTDKVRTTTITTNGIVTSINYTVYSEENGGLKTIEEVASTQNSPFGSAENMRNITVDYAPDAGFSAGRVKYSTDSSGIKTSYSYQRGDYNDNANPALCSFTLNSSGSAAMTEVTSEPLVANKTTKTVSITDSLGNNVLSETWLYTGSGYERLSWEVNRFDSRGHITRSENSNGTFSTTVWGCCNKQSEVLADGTEYTYQYDNMDRVISSVKKGADTTSDITTTYTYDTMGRLLTTTVTAGDKTLKTSQKEYNFAGELIKETDLNGNVTTYDYNLAARTNTTTFPTGLTVITESNIDGSSKSTTGTGTTANFYTYGVNTDGSIWEKTNNVTADSERWSKSITNMQGHAISESPTNESGVTTFTKDYYDDRGNVIRSEVVDSSGNKLQADTISQYNNLNEVIRSGQDIDNDGQLTLASMDIISESTSQYEKIDGNWFSVGKSYSYSKDNNAERFLIGESRSQVTGFSNGVVSYSVSIDAKGNQTISTTTFDQATKTVTQRVNAPAVDTDTITTTVNGLVVSFSDIYGNTATYEHDELGRVIATNEPGVGRNGITVYNDKGEVSSVTDELGATVTFEYDQFGRQVATILPRIGRTDITTFDAKGRVASTTDAAGNTESFVYSDVDNQVIEITNTLGKKVYNEYTNQGQLAKTWGETTYPVSYEYDKLGRMVKMHTYSDTTDFTTSTWPVNTPSPDTTTWNYASITGHLISKTDAKGNSTSYTYDRMGRIKTRTWARADGNGNALVTSYEYDPVTGLQTKVDYSDSTPDIAFTYDNFGRLLSALDAAGTRNFTYNAKGQLTTETLGEFSQTFNYDTLGRENGFSLSQSNSSLINNTLSFDSTGRLDSATQNGASVSYDYLANSNLLAGQSLHNGAFVKEIGYEAKRNLPTSIAYKKDGSTLAARTYVFDNLGRITNRTQERVGESPRADVFGYNDRNEVISSDLGVDPYRYAYDNLGNRISSSTGNSLVVTQYTTNELNQYTQINKGTESFTPVIDLDGNQTEIKTGTGVWQVEYNAENRPVTFTQGDVKIECLYDYMGRRFSKKVYEKNTATTYELISENYFVYDGYLQIANFKVENSAKSLETFTFWDPSESQATRPVAMEQSGAVYYYSHDYTKNVCELFSVDDQNLVTIARSYDYTPFGAVTETIVDSSIENLENNFKFSSESHDAELALCYYNYRHYNPLDGRWISRDPIEEQGGLNLYGLVDNNVLNTWDSLGLWSSWGIYDDHSPFTKKAVDESKKNFSIKIPNKILKKIKKILVKGNLSTDSGDFFEINYWHYNRNIGDSVAKGKAEYRKILSSNTTQFYYSTALEPSDNNCQNQLMRLGRLSHAWQDYYAHAVAMGYKKGDDNKVIGSLSGSPDSLDSNSKPSSYGPRGGEHGNLLKWEPGNNAPDRASRRRRAVSFTASKFKTMIPHWYKACKCTKTVKTWSK